MKEIAMKGRKVSKDIKNDSTLCRAKEDAFHEWVVFSTAIEDQCLMVQCVECGAFGTVDDPTKEEWKKAFYAPSNPYAWNEPDRVTVRDIGRSHVIRRQKGASCNCQDALQAEEHYQRYPAEVGLPENPLAVEERKELLELAEFVEDSVLCSRLFPVFIEGYPKESGEDFSAATVTLAGRIERVDSMGLHFPPAIVAKLIREWAEA